MCNRGQFLGDRSSSRVLAQPVWTVVFIHVVLPHTHTHTHTQGGNSSFSLGWDEPAKPAARPAAAPAPVAAPVQQQPAAVQEKENAVPASTNVPPAAGGKPISSNAWASNSNQNCGNMISERPSTRIHAPPGGKSSITF